MPRHAVRPRHRTRRRQLRPPHPRLHRIQPRISRRPIHHRTKLRMQRQRMIAHIQPEVRRIRHSLNSNLPQRPGKPPRRRQNPADPMNRRQVRMRKLIAPIQRRIPRIVILPRPKLPRRPHIPHRLRIHQHRLIVQRLLRPTSVSTSLLIANSSGFFPGLLVSITTFASVHSIVSTDNPQPRLPPALRIIRHRHPPLLLRRNIHLQPSHLHRHHPRRRPQQLPPPRTELKALHRQHRRRIRPRIRLRRPRQIKNPQPATRHHHAPAHRQRKPVQLHRTNETAPKASPPPSAAASALSAASPTATPNPATIATTKITAAVHATHRLRHHGGRCITATDSISFKESSYTLDAPIAARAEPPSKIVKSLDRGLAKHGLQPATAAPHTIADLQEASKKKQQNEEVQ